MSNFFAHRTAAQRYAQARPYVHPVAIRRFQAVAGTDVPFARVLDAGCGTGMSTVAVAGIAESVVGIDSSPEMLRCTRDAPNIEYQLASAERIPFSDGSFDLVTVACAHHWFDEDAFADEARRVLRTSGWALVYNSWFGGRMRDHDEFTTWFRESYLARYPSPPRGATAALPESLARHGFSLVSEEDFSNDVPMTSAQFVTYLTTQSNVISQVELGAESLDSVVDGLTQAVLPYFGDREQVMVFEGRLWALRRSS